MVSDAGLPLGYAWLALATCQAAATMPMDFVCQTGSPKPGFHLLQGLHFS